MRLPAPTEIVLGPPGTGKTTQLIAIVAEELAAGTPQDRIGYVTFTRRGAHEAQDRMREIHGLSRADLPWFRTMHSLCMRWLGVQPSAILSGAHLQEFGDLVGERITGRFSQDDGTYMGYDRGDRMLFADNLARVRQIPLRQLYEEQHDDIDWTVLERFSAALRHYKEQRALLDYTDLLERMVTGGTAPRLDVLVIDEAQDLSRLQWSAAGLLASRARRAVAGGDDDQSIFRWAGADLQAVLELEGEARVLGHSWRVPRAVQRAAADVVGRIKSRRSKQWSPRESEGICSWIADVGDADLSGGWDEEGHQPVLVLARNQFILEGVMRDLRSAGVLYSHHGHPSVRQQLLDAIVTWEHLRQGRAVTVRDARDALEWITAGAGIRRGHKTLPGLPLDQHVTMSELREHHGLMTDRIWHEALDRIPVDERVYMVRCRRQGERFSQPPRVRVDTIHASKGGEARRVVLLQDMAPRTWREFHESPDDEHRVWYVGMTRAREELQIVRPQTRMAYSIGGD